MPYFVATAINGTQIKEDRGLGRGASFALVQDLERKGLLSTFEVFHEDGMRQGVDLMTGRLWVGGQEFNVVRPATRLRVIYYKRMQASVHANEGGSPVVDLRFVAVGWQTTVENGGESKNIRFGSKAYPSEAHFEVGEDI